MDEKSVESDSTSHEPRYRSGAVARMVRMPVATLRVWERRYALAAPARTASGQRLYSAADVRRIALLKQLTELGHAIGRLASLDMSSLRDVAATHAGVVASSLDGIAAAVPARASRAEPDVWRLAVVGEALVQRLQRPALQQALGRPLLPVGPLADLAQAAACASAGEADALLLQRSSLQPGDVDGLLQGVQAWAGRPVALLVGFAPESACERVAAAGVRLLHEPQGDVALGQWLGLLAPGLSPVPAVHADGGEPAPRRWDDSTLAELAGLSTTIACECPRHLGELLRLLSAFERYSAECAHRGPADAAVHRMLQHATGRSRRELEQALEQVVAHEGLLWPAGAGR